MNKDYACLIIWQRQYERSDWLMGSHSSRVLPSSPVNTDPYCPLPFENFNMSESDQFEFYSPDENENINSHEEIQKKRRFVIESDDED